MDGSIFYRLVGPANTTLHVSIPIEPAHARARCILRTPSPLFPHPHQQYSTRMFFVDWMTPWWTDGCGWTTTVLTTLAHTSPRRTITLIPRYATFTHTPHAFTARAHFTAALRHFAPHHTHTPHLAPSLYTWAETDAHGKTLADVPPCALSQARANAPRTPLAHTTHRRHFYRRRLDVIGWIETLVGLLTTLITPLNRLLTATPCRRSHLLPHSHTPVLTRVFLHFHKTYYYDCGFWIPLLVSSSPDRSDWTMTWTLPPLPILLPVPTFYHIPPFKPPPCGSQHTHPAHHPPTPCHILDQTHIALYAHYTL